tara:strand:- start:185 stop:346 length:162 start_codon:yes stop_codon:yes gene_type:complete
MNNIFRIIIIALLSYIAIINYNYVRVGWCESEIQVFRDQSSALISFFEIEMEN